MSNVQHCWSTYDLNLVPPYTWKAWSQTSVDVIRLALFTGLRANDGEEPSWEGWSGTKFALKRWINKEGAKIHFEWFCSES